MQTAPNLQLSPDYRCCASSQLPAIKEFMTSGLPYHDVSTGRNKLIRPWQVYLARYTLVSAIYKSLESYSGLMMHFLALPPTVARKMASWKSTSAVPLREQSLTHTILLTVYAIFRNEALGFWAKTDISATDGRCDITDTGYTGANGQDNKIKVFPSHCEKTNDCYGPWISWIELCTLKKLLESQTNVAPIWINPALRVHLEFNSRSWTACLSTTSSCLFNLHILMTLPTT